MKKVNDKKEYILEYDMVFANIFSLILLILMILITAALFFLMPSDEIDILISEKFGFTFGIFFVIMILWMVLHEIIHGIAYQVMGAKNKDIVFGASLENGVFYCKCKEYVNKKCIMTSLLAPFVLIGVVTYIIGFIINSPLLVILSIINISGASGDLMMFNFFLKQDADVEFKELGFSSPFVLRTSKDLSDKKYLGIKSIREVKDKSETEEGPEKKVTISKVSWIIIIVMIVLFGLLMGLDYLDTRDRNTPIDWDKYNEEVLAKNEKASELTKLYSEKNESWNIIEENYIEEYPEMTFNVKRDNDFITCINLQQNGNEKSIISGWPIIFVYKYDLTGDGRPEVIANVMVGSGLVDRRVVVYDIYNDRKYELSDRGEYDYYLYYVDNEFKVIKISYDLLKGEAYQGVLKFIKAEEHEDGGYLIMDNEEKI